MSATLELQVLAFPIEPLDGMYANVPSNKIPVGGSPDMMNCYVRGDMLLKRPGFSPVGDRVHATERVMGIHSALDEDDNAFLFASTQTGLKRYSPGTDLWTAYTGPALTGGTERLFSWCVSQNSLVFSQGEDEVMRVPFSGTVYAVLNANCPPARFLCRFADRLYVAHTVESAAVKPFRVRRSVNSDHTNWTGLGSGFNDLSEFPYHIKGMTKHGAQLLVCSEEALWIATRTGVSASPAGFEPAVTGTGLYCPYVLTTRGNEHLGMSRDAFWLFNGSQTVEIMQQVRDSVFNALNAAKVHMNFGVIRPASQEWVVFLCLGATSTPETAWIWNYGKNICYPWEFTGPVCGVIHRQDESRIWNGLVGDWDAQTWEWTLSEGLESFPLLHTGHKDGYVYKWRDDYFSDNGASIPCRWTSRDFFSADIFGPDQRFRQIALKSLAVEYKGTGAACTLNFYLSVNGGRTWEGPYEVELASSATGSHLAVLSEQISGNKVRWKFEHTSADETFKIVRFIPEFELLGMPLIPDEEA